MKDFMTTQRLSIKEIILSTFLIDDMEFGIDASIVIEAIFHKSAILKLPTGLDVFEGVINLRGNIIPIINMRKRFGLDNIDSETKCIAVVSYKEHFIGLMFDNISQVIRVDRDEIANFSNNTNDEYFVNEGVVLFKKNNSLIQILDLELVFKDCDLHLLKNTSIDNKKFLEVKQDITFYLDEQEYSFGMDDIQEIVNFVEIKNKVEHCEFVCGVITLREEIIPVVCLKKYFGNKNATRKKDSKIIILRSNPAVGIIADSIKEVIHYEVDKLLPVNHIAESKSKNIFSNIIALSENRNIIKISLEKLFTEEAKKQIEAGVYLNKEDTSQKNNYSSSLLDQKTQDNRILNKEFILFKLNEIFAIQIDKFQEIIKYTNSIADLPGSDDYIEGLLNLRSEPVLVINLRKYYNLPDYLNKNDVRILIVNVNNQKIGIMVDEVMEILKTDKTEVTRSPQLTQRNMTESYCKHIKEIMCVKSKGKDSNCSALVLEFNIDNFISSINLEKTDIEEEIIDTEVRIEDSSVNTENETKIQRDIIKNAVENEFKNNFDYNITKENNEGLEYE